MLRFSVLSSLLAALLATSVAANEESDLAERQQRLMAETDRLLVEVEQSVIDQVEQAERELDEQARALATAFEAPAEGSATATDLEAERQRLLAKVRELRTDDFIATQLVVDAQEINGLRARALIIAGANGLDVEKLTRLYEAGLKVIRTADFERADNPRPSRDERLSTYFRSLFTWASAEYDEASHIAENIEYKLGLYKRMSFAYMEALLASGEERPLCTPTEPPSRTVELAGRILPVLDCPDPVVHRLRAYVDAVRTMQSADADVFLSLAEEVVAQQQLATDFMAAVPLVGDAIDIYSVLAGESLAGQCMSPFERSLTGLFAAVPIVGPSLVRYTLKHSEAAALGLQTAKHYFDAVAEVGNAFGRSLSGLSDDALGGVRAGVQSSPALTGLARQFGIEPEEIRGAYQLIGRPWNPEEFLTPKQLRAYRDSQITFRTLQDARANRVRVSRLSGEIGDRALAESAERMAKNVTNGAMETTRRVVVDGSNMVPAHVNALVEVAARRDEVLLFRAVNPDATRLIDAHFATKGMTVKGKSADWGPHAGMIPVDQKFSKLGNPRRGLDPAGVDAGDIDDIAEFHTKVDDCLRDGPCGKMEAVTGDGQRIVIVPDAAAGREMPVVFDGSDYLDPDTGRRVDLTPDQVANRRPMEVLAVRGSNGEMKPLTADYDFLAIGDRGEVQTPIWDNDIGAVTGPVRETLADVNETISTRALHEDGFAYQGGNIVHHGPETWYPGSPGALKNDPEITVLDPQQGPLLIRRCDVDCMQKWCNDTGLCGGLRVCGEPIAPPCIPVDPDRILKDYFHAKRLDGYNLSPNAAWGWGDYNGLGGWTVDGFLRAETYLQWMSDAVGLAPLTRRALWAGRELLDDGKGGVQWMFECGEEGN